ncbi:glycine--tRNA ligase subunit beta [Pontibaca sp. S1109L]|uniref:Glycine--tRNA ligase beta subunit n=2 Tax=Pontibaca salina TaxID=2795731 RepID=A0A934HSC4_9RHOB|nr:glycine--tRNA ligase subunit beta [Pontibaca salina]MBI6630532.1 glycine--tRNA ligase subunit beta [Pontibaca salina]
MPDLLIELFSEEIPARMQVRAAKDLKQRITDGLVEAGLTYAGAEAFATPRRLTLAIEGLTAESPTVREERRGPRVDAPEKAVQGFLRGAGLTLDQLEKRDTPKGEVYFALIEKPGRQAAEIVAEVLEAVVRNFPWPKSMRWGHGSLRWVRPLHSILCILTDEDGAQVVPLAIDGIAAGNSTEGHRFMSQGRFSVSSFEDYEAKLKRAHVMLSASERVEHIWHDATNMAFASGLELVEDRALLDEVAGLVEWPVVLMGEIDPEYLELPPEVLQTSMREHQKFFSVRDSKSGKIVRFVTVANRETADNGAIILAGNRKVLGARLADAQFFWHNDLRIAQAEIGNWTQALDNVTFHNKLGSQGTRIARIAALAREIAPVTGADPDAAEQAALLAKADLSSEMVGEFPELQGVMGRYYIAAAGYDAAVAQAAQEHYSPLGPSDTVPSAPVSVAVALADKIDTLTGFWAIDEKPTGSKDPFALRRAALGVIRLVLENDLVLDLNLILTTAFVAHGVLGPDPTNSADCKGVADRTNLLAFLHDRLKVHLREQGIRHDIIDACIAMPNSDDLTLLVKRAQALDAELKTEEGENLLQGFKRANNILSQAEEKDGVEYSFGADPKFAEDPSETALFAALEQAEPQIESALAQEDFPAAMATMAGLRGPIDAFFEAVQINTENQTLRRNRLNLLHQIRATCMKVADLTRIEG